MAYGDWRLRGPEDAGPRSFPSHTHWSCRRGDTDRLELSSGSVRRVEALLSFGPRVFSPSLTNATATGQYHSTDATTSSGSWPADRRRRLGSWVRPFADRGLHWSQTMSPPASEFR